MVRTVAISSLCCIALFGQSYAQEVMIAREGGAHHATSQPKKAEPIKKAEAVKHEPSTSPSLARENFPKAQPVSESFPKAQPVKERVAKQQSPMVQIVKEKAPAPPAVAQSAKAKPQEKETTASTPPPVRKPEPSVLVDTKSASSGTGKLLWPKKGLVNTQTVKAPPAAKEPAPAPPIAESAKLPAAPPTNSVAQTVKPSSSKSANAQPVVELGKPAANAVAQSVKSSSPAKSVNVDPTKSSATKIANAQPVVEPVKAEVHAKEPSPAAPALAQTKKSQPLISWTPRKEVRAEQTSTAQTLAQPPNKLQSIASRTSSKSTSDAESTAQPVTFRGDTAFTKLADGFDFPVGKPDAQGYYKARGFRSHGHLGEDWDGVRGGDTDLGDPIYCIGDGVVVFARDCHMGWGNVVIVRHSYRDNGMIKNIDSLYGHLNTMLVHRGQAVARGQKIATMGNAHGLYDAHLHLEIRKNLEIGMSRAAFARDFSNYYDPTQFINSHRHLQASSASYRIAMNTFTRDAKINFDKKRNYSHGHSGGGTSESAAALKKAVAAQSSH